MQRLGLCVQPTLSPHHSVLSTAILATFPHNFLLTWASRIVSDEPTAAMRVRQAARRNMEVVRMVWSTLEVSYIMLDSTRHKCRCERTHMLDWLVLSGGEVLIKDICIHKQGFIAIAPPVSNSNILSHQVLWRLGCFHVNQKDCLDLEVK